MSMYLESSQGMSWEPHEKGIIVRRTNSSEDNNRNTSGQSMNRQKFSCNFCCSSTKSESQRKHQTSPYALYLNEELTPRSSTWIYLAAASLAGLASLLVVEQPMHSEVQRNGQDTLLMSTLSTSFIISLLVAICYRHRGLRNSLTCEILPHTSLELLSAVALLVLWCIELRYVMDPFSGVEHGKTLTNELMGEHYYESVWNDNLWFSSWLGAGTISYLVGELMTGTDKKRKGVVVKSDNGLQSTGRFNGSNEETNMRSYNLDDDGSTHWFLDLVSSCSLTAFCIDYRIGMSCEGILSSTPFCRRCTLGAAVGLLSAVISAGAIIMRFLHRRNIKDDTRHAVPSHKKFWRLEAVFALLSFTSNCINLGFITSPGGPGAEIGNIFVSAWAGVIISMVLCISLENGWTLRLKPQGAESLEENHVNCMMDSDSGVKEQYPKEKHPRKRSNHGQKSTQYDPDSSTPFHISPTRVFISKATNKQNPFSSDSSSSSSSRCSSSISESLANTESIQMLDTNGDCTSGEKTTSTYSLPLPPPICLDSSDDRNLSRPSLSPTLNSLNGGQISSQAMSKTNMPSQAPPPPPYNDFSCSLENHIDQADERSISIDEDDDENSAIEICVDHPDDVSSLGMSRLSLGNSGHSNVDPDGYKSEDNYKDSPHTKKSNRTRSSKTRASRVKRLMSDELPTVEEQSYSTQSRIESSTTDETTEQIMKLGNKIEEGPFNRLDSGNVSSIGPITVDESVSNANT